MDSGGLPAGLNLNSTTGLISGTPTAAGDSQFQIKVSDSSGRSDVQTYSLSVVEPLKVANAPAAAEVGIPFNLTLAATGGRGPYTWSVTGLPAGLAFDAASGTVSGTPMTAGLATLKVTAKDSLGLQTTVDQTVAVAGALTVVSRALPIAKVRAAYVARVRVTGGVIQEELECKTPGRSTHELAHRRNQRKAATPRP